MNEQLQLKKLWIEAQVAELGRMLPQVVILISVAEVKQLQMLLERILYDAWDTAQKPLLEALLVKMAE